jgi:predicted lipoprotein with Yx(FWY)xxD motif
MRNRWLAGPGLAAVAVIALTACGSSGGSSASGGSAPAAGSSSAAAGGGGSVRTMSSSAGTVLTNSKGFALYTFAADKGSTSVCYGQCATFWPPLMGPVTVASGVKVSGKFGVTTRKDGSKQVTWNGHPLYTYAGDKSGTVNGNGKNIDGGVWNVVTTSGAAAPAPSQSSSSSGGSGGYGY